MDPNLSGLLIALLLVACVLAFCAWFAKWIDG